MHKLAMILSASAGDSMRIELEHLVLADKMLAATETDLDKVFSRIGRSEDSLQAERFLGFVRRHGKVSYEKALQFIQSYFPDFRDFEGMLTGHIRAGLIRVEFHGIPKMRANGEMYQDANLIYTGD